MKIKYSILKDSDLENAAHCVASRFVESEVLTVGAKLEFEEYFPVAKKVCQIVIPENLSFGCFNSDTHELLGCIVAGDFTTPPPTLDAFSPKIKPVYGLLGSLDESYSSKNEIKPGEQLHVLFAAVYQQHQGMKIYQNLRNEVHQNAKTQGYKFVLGEVSGLASQRVTVEKFNNEILDKVVYSEFEFEGKKPFSGIENPPACLLVRGQL